MANIKFSQFTVGNTESDIDFVVGYKGANNIQISPTNLLAASLSGYLPLTGGTMSGNVIFNDLVKASFGNSEDLKILHDGTNSAIINERGDLNIQQREDDADIIFSCDDGAGGVTEYFRLDGGQEVNVFSKNIKLEDNVKGLFGGGNDLQILHNGTDSYIQNNTGNLFISNFANDKDIRFATDDGSGGTATYFFLDGSTASGGSLYTQFPDSSNLTFGAGNDLRIYHNGTNSNIENFNGALQFVQNLNDGDINFLCDDGAGGVTTYFQLDGGAEIVVASKEFRFLDNVPVKLGTGPDFQMLHNGTSTSIENSTGNLLITNFADDSDIIFKSDDGSGGVTTYLTIDGGNTNVKFSKDLYLLDNVKARIGTGSDLQISHDATDSYIQNFTGDLKIFQNADDKDITFYNDDGLGGTTAYFFLDGSLELNRFLKSTLYNDNIRASFGDSSDLQIYHDGTTSYIKNAVGNLNIRQNADDADISFQCDDGSGSLAEYFRLDGSSVQTIAEKDFRFIDNAKVILGTGSDLQIYHNASNSIIENFVGDLILKNSANDKDIIFQSDDGSGGTATYFLLDGSIGPGTGSVYTRFPDNSRVVFGTSSDLQIYHDGSNSYIYDGGTGNLEIRSNFLKVKSPTAEDMIWAQENAGITLFHNNVAKLATTSTGVRITGVSEYADNTAAIAGGLTTGDVYRTGDLLKIVH